MKANQPAAPPKTVDEYLAGLAEPARSTLDKVRSAIRAAVGPEAEEVLSYRIPTFRYHGALVAYAAFTGHCSLFPMSYAVIGSVRNSLQRYEISKGTIRFPLDKPLPTTVVRRIVRARMAENRRRKAAKPAR